MESLLFEPAYVVAGKVAAGDVSAVELTEAALRQVERYGETLNPFITLTAEQALEAAHQRDAERAGDSILGPLHGVPIVLKDLLDTAGVPTTGGSAIFRDRTPAEDATVVRLLRQAGAISIGKTGMPEFAELPTSTNPHYGAVHNPWNPDLDTAGSSSGTGAAIASGMAFTGPGSDTGGSIRMPASACGLVGLKPTYGRVSLRGVLPLSASLDHIGPMARTVRDVALMLDILARYDPDDPYSRDAPPPNATAGLEQGVAGLRIAAFSDDGEGPVSDEILQAFRQGLNTMTAAGAQIEEVDLSIIHQFSDDPSSFRADVAAHYGEQVAGREDELSEYVRDAIESGRQTSGAAAMEDVRRRRNLMHQIERRLSGFDLAVSPTLALSPPPAGEYCHELLRFTSVWDQNGWPAASVPVGVSSDGIPIGFQIIGRPWREAEILRAARIIEREHALAFPPPALAAL